MTRQFFKYGFFQNRFFFKFSIFFDGILDISSKLWEGNEQKVRMCKATVG